MNDDFKRKIETILNVFATELKQEYYNEFGIPSANIEFYQNLHQTINREKMLHPEPHDFHGWYNALKNKWEAFATEINYDERYSQHIHQFKDKLTELLGVGCLMLLFLDDQDVHRAAMEYDP